MDAELETAVRMANKALDEPNSDPDDDLRTISRQFLRLCELKPAAARPHVEVDAGEAYLRASRPPKVAALEDLDPSVTYERATRVPK